MEWLGNFYMSKYHQYSSARNIYTGQEVAIKKVQKVFEKSILTKRGIYFFHIKTALREIKLLRHFNGHENITAIFDMEVEDIDKFNEMYFG